MNTRTLIRIVARPPLTKQAFKVSWRETVGRTCDETELCGEFGRNLGNHVAAQVAGLQFGVSHQVIHCIGYLHQLTLGQICRGIEDGGGISFSMYEEICF